MSIDQMIDALIAREGGYVNSPDDLGSETNFGVTKAVARAYGYFGDMRVMPRAVAVNIYRKKYFTEPKFDRVYALSQRIAEEMFDTGVNMGVAHPAPWLQRILNALNRKQGDYPDIKVDGDIGPATVASLRALLNKRGADGEKAILRLLNCLQGVRYLDITEAREANETFLFGWIMNRLEIC